MDDRCVLSKELMGNKEVLHSDYINYCWAKNYRRLNMNGLGRELVKHGIHYAQRGTGKERRHIWSGIVLKDENENQGTLFDVAE
jgi:hypothetical protein